MGKLAVNNTYRHHNSFPYVHPCCVSRKFILCRLKWKIWVRNLEAIKVIGPPPNPRVKDIIFKVGMCERKLEKIECKPLPLPSFLSFYFLLLRPNLLLLIHLFFLFYFSLIHSLSFTSHSFIFFSSIIDSFPSPTDAHYPSHNFNSHSI